MKSFNIQRAGPGCLANSAGAILALCCWIVTWQFVGAQDFQLTVAGIEDGNVVHLVISGAGTDSVTLQASRDLVNWVDVGTTVPSDGIARFDHSTTDQASPWFYRAQSETSEVVPPIVALTDPNRYAETVATTEEGGILEFMDDDGVNYRLTIDPGCLAAAALVRMTLVTNYTAFPDNDGYHAAVVFEPDGLEFAQPATLTINYPDGMDLPVFSMMAYSVGNQGTTFEFLPPSYFDTNVIVVPIYHFSAAGAAAFSGSSIGKVPHGYSTSRPDLDTGLDRAAREVRQTMDDFAAGKITADEFQKRINEVSVAKHVYDTTVKRYLALARTDCGVGRTVTKDLNRVEYLWRRENGGKPTETPYTKELVEIARAMRCNCAHEVFAACEEGSSVDPGLQQFRLNQALILAQISTLENDGTGCDLGSDEDIIRRFGASKCGVDWIGHLRVEQTHRRLEVSGFGTNPTYSNKTDHWTVSSFEGDITKVNKRDRGPIEFGNEAAGIFETWELQVHGTLTGIYYESDISETTWSDGVDTKSITEDRGQSSVEVDGLVFLSFRKGEFDTIWLESESVPGEKPLAITRTTRKDVICPPKHKYDCGTPEPAQSKLLKNLSISVGITIHSDDKNFSKDCPKAGCTWNRAKGELNLNFIHNQDESPNPQPIGETITEWRRNKAKIWLRGFQ